MGRKDTQRGQKRADQARARRRRRAREQARVPVGARDRPASDEELRDLLCYVRDDLDEAIGETIYERDPQAARDCLAGVLSRVGQGLAEGDDPDEAALPMELSILVLVGRLRSIRDVHGDDSLVPRVVAWIGDELGPDVAATAQRAGALLSPVTPDDTIVGRVLDELSDDLLPALVWLVSGAVAVLGAGDPAWLAQFDD